MHKVISILDKFFLNMKGGQTDPTPSSPFQLGKSALEKPSLIRVNDVFKNISMLFDIHSNSVHYSVLLVYLLLC